MFKMPVVWIGLLAADVAQAAVAFPDDGATNPLYYRCISLEGAADRGFVSNNVGVLGTPLGLNGTDALLIRGPPCSGGGPRHVAIGGAP